MKIKELQKTVNIAWSPAQQNPILLAAGTSAQQLDASFSTNASLEIYSINLSDPGFELELQGATASQHRFNKVVWSHHGFGAHHPNGLIVGACENGVVQVYSASKLLQGEDALIGQQGKHSGSVLAIDFNPFQANLLATGASDSEIFIWDLNNITTPMTPGTKITPNEDVLNVNWNKQVQHILATVFSSKCVIWDLRKNEPIIKLHDTQSRVRWRAQQWNPEVPTQLWLGSEEDSSPTMQLWDLRYATAPAKSIQIHQRGVLGLTWCAKDTDLMISCGKDNKILCWNPNSESQEGEILSEIATTNQWCFDVSWCPRNPGIVAGCSFDGTVSLYSLFGGSVAATQTTSKIADSFPGMDPHQMVAPVQQTNVHNEANDLRKPPKWLKRPVGARFGFGGKLYTFNNKDNSKVVTVSQVVTDEDLVKRSNELENVLAQGNFSEYCRQKADETTDQHSRYLWYFLKANFEQNPRAEMLNLLGYAPEEISAKYSQFIKKDDSVTGLTEQVSQLSTDPNNLFDTFGQQNGISSPKKEKQFKLNTGNDSEGLICGALLTGNIEAAVDLCMDAGRHTDAIILAMTGGSELLARTQYRYLRDNDNYISNVISALVTHDWNEVISRCSIDSWKEALVAALTHSQDQLPQLCEAIGERLLQESRMDPGLAKNAILCYLCSGSMEKLVESWNIVQSSNTSSPAKGSAKTKNIQDLVEIIMILQKAGEMQGKNVEVVGKVADVLSKYAGLLAAQGSLQSALTYLGPSVDPELVELKDRLYYALGHKQQQQTQRAPQQQQQQQQQNIYGIQRLPQSRSSSISSNLPPVVPLQQQFNATPVQPTVSNFFAPPPTPPVAQIPPVPMQTWNTNPSTFNQQQPAAPIPPPAAPPLTKPPTSGELPRPSSRNSALGRKYVVDPSVQSGSNVYGSPSGLFGGNVSQPAVPAYTQGPIPPAPTTFNTNPIQAQPMGQFSGFNSMPMQSNTMLPPVEMGQPALINPQKNPTPPPGWNDPPPLSMRALARAKPQVKPEITPAAPITHPLFGVADTNQGQNGYMQQDLQPQTYGMQNPMQQNFGMQQPMQPVMQPASVPAPVQQNFNQGFPPQVQFQQNFQQPQQQQQQQANVAAPPPPQVAPEPQKAPLPEEYIYLQTVFEELRTMCIKATSNPQSKRKLEDVAKRLELLYDLLRENRLSPNTLAQLNQMVQLMQTGDYVNGLHLHTQMASGPDFSTIASFMPGVKSLLQSAMQLQVYLN
ncbi:protein transport protein Sec31A [Culicoides brevitarsis]|uniref:protein transport protein Sec31A n=1 Tax=Culicoides brevitarsis TaxID=469753 RepID=UPI00307C7B14